MRTLVDEALKAAHITAAEIEGVVPVGGSPRTPRIIEMLEGVFGPEKILKGIDVEHAKVLGAAGLIGVKITEAIAAGKTELANIISGYELRTDIQMKGITMWPLGVVEKKVSTGRAVLVSIIKAQTPLPATASEEFGLDVTTDAGSANTMITVLQGEAECLAEEAPILAEIPLTGLPPGPRESRVRITFDMDTNGVTKVRALDTFSDKEIRGEATALTCGCIIMAEPDTVAFRAFGRAWRCHWQWSCMGIQMVA